ncbi:MAG: hypothetical protein ABIQ62_04770 [Thermomonas sp.]
MIVLLHGWSDHSESFKPLVAKLAGLGLNEIVPINLGDYVSMDDDVTFDDIIRAMQAAWKKANLPTAPRSVDVIVHSTGALVIRHWMTSCFTPESNPVRRLLMLAPANFGSHLAHKGVSFIGRIAKGFKSDRLFHTGEKILRGLELASPFTWELGRKDRLQGGPAWYGPGRVLATVLVGTGGYTGISAAANTSGSDGTVLVSTANLNPAFAQFDFATDPAEPTLMTIEANGRTAFCRVPGENHNTIAGKDNGPKNPVTLQLIRQALAVTDAGFDAHCQALATLNAQHRRAEQSHAYTQGYQNLVMYVEDDQGQPVGDYFIEVFVKQQGRNAVDNTLTAIVQREVMASVHTNQVNSAFRSLKMNCDILQTHLIDGMRPLYISITAHPEIKDTRSVGYSTISYKDIGSIKIDINDLGKIFMEDRTLFVHLVIKRTQVESLVRFAKAAV